VLKYEQQRSILTCIHCGACTNVCPVYKNIGGPAYNTSYIGPHGTVLTPLMRGMKNYAHLTSLCALCGKCSTVCPVQIPIDDLMTLNRREMIDQQYDDPKLNVFFKMLIKSYKSRKLMNMSSKIKNFTMRNIISKNYGDRKIFPKFAPKTFSKMWQEMNNKNE
jgi:L-lactate dehydrogenase complex protein LldF